MSHTATPDHALPDAGTPAAAAAWSGATTKSWALLAVALAAQILVVLDISVVNTALPLHRASPWASTAGNLQWLVTAYLMMSGGGLLLGGRIADLLSRRGVFLTGLALFTVASIVSGFADSRRSSSSPRGPSKASARHCSPRPPSSLIMTTYAGASARRRSPCGAPSAASVSPSAFCSAGP